MALITTGNWEAGDDLRIIEALKLPFGSYTLQCTQDCCNQLEVMSPEAVLNVRALLARYEAAETLQINADLADTEGKTLVKADVLEWEKDPGTTPSGPEQEMMRAHQDLAQYFAFCSCMGGLQGGGSYSTSLIRS
jgi:hypothetical protein